jgi:membrane protease YdiL (CAAX protease family)
MTSLLHHILVLFLVVAMPIWDRGETRRLKTSTDPNVRRDGYIKTIVWQLVVCAILIATVPFQKLYQLPATAQSIPKIRGDLLIPIVVGLTLGVLAPIFVFRKKPETAKQLEAISFFLPQTRLERWVFALMCFTVGICEELIFRGFLIQYVHALPLGFGWAVSVVLAAIVFGIDHGYQGWLGIITTTCLAFVFTALFWMSGTLLLPMIFHVAIDLRVLAMWRPKSNNVS